MTEPDDHRQAAGFTLFELLVALVLLSLLTMVLTGQIRFGLRAWESGAAVADDIAELQTIQNFLRRQLARAQPLRSKVEDDEDARRSQPIFSGDPRELRLAVAGLARLGPAPYNIITISYGLRSGAGRLELDWRPHYPVTKGSSGVESRQRVLLTGIKNLRFSYFGDLDPRDREAPPRWHEKWNDRVRLPRLIRIELDFDDGGRYWPELTVALPIER